MRQELVEFYRRRRAAPRVDLCPLADPSLTAGSQLRGIPLREEAYR